MFLLMQIDSLYTENRTKEMSSLKEWFSSNDSVKNEKFELEYFIHISMSFNQILLVLHTMYFYLYFMLVEYLAK